MNRDAKTTYALKEMLMGSCWFPDYIAGHDKNSSDFMGACENSMANLRHQTTRATVGLFISVSLLHSIGPTWLQHTQKHAGISDIAGFKRPTWAQHGPYRPNMGPAWPQHTSKNAAISDIYSWFQAPTMGPTWSHIDPHGYNIHQKLQLYLI